MTTKSIVACGASLLVVALAACGTNARADAPGFNVPDSTNESGRYVSVDGPVVTGIDELVASSSSVVAGTFLAEAGVTSEGEIIAHSGDAAGLPLTLWRFRVDRVVEGAESLAGTTIRVAQTPGVDGTIASASAGLDAVVFVNPYPGTDVYAVAGLGAGVLAITDDGLRAASTTTEELRRDVADHDSLDAVARIASE